MDKISKNYNELKYQQKLLTINMRTLNTKNCSLQIVFNKLNSIYLIIMNENIWNKILYNITCVCAHCKQYIMHLLTVGIINTKLLHLLNIKFKAKL